MLPEEVNQVLPILMPHALHFLLIVILWARDNNRYTRSPIIITITSTITIHNVCVYTLILFNFPRRTNDEQKFFKPKYSCLLSFPLSNERQEGRRQREKRKWSFVWVTGALVDLWKYTSYICISIYTTTTIMSRCFRNK